jgi:hypothetical protein
LALPYPVISIALVVHAGFVELLEALDELVWWMSWCPREGSRIWRPWMSWCGGCGLRSSALCSLGCVLTIHVAFQLECERCYDGLAAPEGGSLG